MSKEKSLGEKLIRIDFNKRESPTRDAVTHTTAQMINYINLWRDLDPRLADLAIEGYEKATMIAEEMFNTKNE